MQGKNILEDCFFLNFFSSLLSSLTYLFPLQLTLIYDTIYI